jgi:stage II sporulation protein D
MASDKVEFSPMNTHTTVNVNVNVNHTNRMIRWLFLLGLLLALISPAKGATGDMGTLRIGLTNLGRPSTFYFVPSDGKVEIYCPAKNDGVYSGPAKVVTAKKLGKSMQILVDNRKVYAGNAPIFVSPIGKTPHFLWVGSQTKLKTAFRGTIEVSPHGSGLFAINVINITEYLRSVVPAEIGTKVPEEAFAAQAIAARTYAFRNRDRHEKEGYQLCDKQHCQVYFGIQREIPAANRAVEKTIGQVLLFGDSLANTVYHCNCGGKIHASHEIWGGKGVPYLVTHLDTMGNSEPFCSWSAKGKRRIERVSTIVTSVKPPVSGKSSSRSGNSRKQQLRFAFHSSRGHRVGMCQDGAIGMAQQGYSYSQILSFYYPNTSLRILGKSHKGKFAPLPETKPLGNNRLVLAAAAPSLSLHAPEVPARIEPITRGMKTQDFRKWFWATTPPTLYQRGMKIAEVSSKRRVKSSTKSRKLRSRA